MSIEGLWTIQFSETEEFYENLQVGEAINRGGNFVLINDQVMGAGLSFYFTGTYEAGPSTILMTITANRYNDLVPGMFGDATSGNLTLSGTVDNNKMKLHGYLENDKSKKVFLEAQKRTSV